MKTRRFTIGSLQAVIAIVAVLLASRNINRFNLFFYVVIACCELAIPLFLLVAGDARRRSAAVITGVVLVIAYLVWGWSVVFSPWQPAGCPTALHWFYAHFDLIDSPESRGFCRLVRRWNWGLLAIFYIALLADLIPARTEEHAARREVERPASLGERRSFRPAIEVSALFGLGWGLGILLSWAYIALVPSLVAWSGLNLKSELNLLRSEMGRPLTTASIHHETIAIPRNLPYEKTWGEAPIYYVFAFATTAVAAMTIAAITIRYARDKIGRRAFLAALTVYWGFAVSVQLVEFPYPVQRSRIIFRTIKPGLGGGPHPKVMTTHPKAMSK